jgi:predicted metal-binding transcription factor (methanogenesis marker protein 9)
MTKPIIRIHDLATDKTIDREMTDDEYTQFKKDQALAESFDLAAATKENDKSLLLTKLGITEDEARLLLS